MPSFGVETRINILVERDTLSIEEIKKLVQCIREIEQNKPERVIRVWIDTPEKTVKEMEEMLSSIKPEIPNKIVIELRRKE